MAGALTVIQGEDIHEEVVSGLSKEFPWASMLAELSSLIDNKDFYDQTLVKKAGVRAVRIWGDTTVLEERKDTLQKLKKEIDHKEVTTHMSGFTDIAPSKI